jgi:AraC-like DNA-binding protein
MNELIAYICLTGLVLPLVLMVRNKGYLSTNRYLAGFLFFASLYLLENFNFFYGKSSFWISFFTTTHAFFYLIGPFAFFYVRSILADHSKLSKVDYLHFALFGISFIGYLPYFFSSWTFKEVIANNIMSNDWDMAPFHINKLIPHKLDQLLNLLQTYFYCLSLWYLLWHYKKKSNSYIAKTHQYRLIRRWILSFVSIFSIIAVNFTIAMAYLWTYDDKLLFLQLANGSLLFASCVYIFMNTSLLFFPNILYGLPVELGSKPLQPELSTIYEERNTNGTTTSLVPADAIALPDSNAALKLFTQDYINIIELALQKCIESEVYMKQDFKLGTMSIDSEIPAHHLTYYFNVTLGSSFSDWRNNLRIAHSIKLIEADKNNQYTLQGIGELAGFSSNSTFLRAFKNTTGYTPSEYLSKMAR